MWDLLLTISLQIGKQQWNQSSPPISPIELFPWEDISLFQPPELESDPAAAKITNDYIAVLARRGLNAQRQGIWLQSGWNIAASNQGKIPLSAASLTKVATTLAALSHWGSEHRFVTDIYLDGDIVNGALEGDLIVQGNGDPLFVWEEAIALGNTLNQLGIQEIKGNLLIAGDFYMNFQGRPERTGELMAQAWNVQEWSKAVTKQYLAMPQDTPQPTILLQGEIKVIRQKSGQAKLLVRHRSLTLGTILRQMNIYSNNKMAQMLADSLGGAKRVSQIAAQAADFSAAEIQLINGSGLGEANKISPRGVCQMFLAIQRLLSKDQKDVADLFPTAGRDLVGTLQGRGLPRGTVVKTGTLDQVSALAGVVPTSDRGYVYFSLINSGRSINYFRQQQDQLLNALSQNWQVTSSVAQAKPTWYFGDPRRNKIF